MPPEFMGQNICGGCEGDGAARSRVFGPRPACRFCRGTGLPGPICACTGAKHVTTCPLWVSRTCECDPMGEGLDHHPWCGQHPRAEER